MMTREVHAQVGADLNGHDCRELAGVALKGKAGGQVLYRVAPR
jgi:hypothetical protein